MTENLPTLYEELNRKALESLKWLVEQHEAGYISDAELYTARVAMFNTIAGLVDNEITQLTFTDPLPEDRKEVTQRVLRKGDSVLILSHRVGTTSVELTTLAKSGLRRSERTFDSPRQAREWLDKAVRSLTAMQGFVTI